MTDPQTFLLEKITLSYVATEDRISMHAQIKGGEPVMFWLTQRLCRELIKAMVAYFDKNFDNNASLRQGKAAAPTSPAGKSMLQSYYQEAAVQNKPRIPSVDATSSSRAPVLVQTLNIRTNPEAIVLRLPMPDGAVTAMPLKPEEARQLLQILHVQYRRAEWPMDVWPTWIGQTPAASAGGGEPLH